VAFDQNCATWSRRHRQPTEQEGVATETFFDRQQLCSFQQFFFNLLAFIPVGQSVSINAIRSIAYFAHLFLFIEQAAAINSALVSTRKSIDRLM
jgi:hypothetical protein